MSRSSHFSFSSLGILLNSRRISGLIILCTTFLVPLSGFAGMMGAEEKIGTSDHSLMLSLLFSHLHTLLTLNKNKIHFTSIGL